MASVRVSSSSNVSSSNAPKSTSSKATKAAASVEQDEQDERPEFALADATLVDFVEQYDVLFANMLKSGEKNPTQAAYAKTVADGLTRLGWTAASRKIAKLVSAASAPFAPATVESRFSSLQRVVKGEFDPEYHASIRELYWTEFEEMSLGQIIKAVRVDICEMVFRFFHTYDLKEMRFDRESNKEVIVCLPQNATYRRGDHVYSDEEFVDFMSDLLDAYSALLVIDFDAVRTLFREAGAAAKQMRDEFFAKVAAEKAQQKRDSRTKAGISKPAAPKETKAAPAGHLKIVAVKSNGAVLASAPPARNPWAERKAVAEAKAAEPEAVEAVEAVPEGFTVVKRHERAARAAVPAHQTRRGRGRGSRVVAPAQQ